MTHYVIGYRTVTRLGATEWKKTCSCGLSIQHPNSSTVRALFNVGHALPLGMDVTHRQYDRWVAAESVTT